jgi:hypothetical protein
MPRARQQDIEPGVEEQAVDETSAAAEPTLEERVAFLEAAVAKQWGVTVQAEIEQQQAQAEATKALIEAQAAADEAAAEAAAAAEAESEATTEPTPEEEQ